MDETQTPPTLGDILASYGGVQIQPLSRIQAFTAKAMARNWTTIPHVTHHDLIDVTDLELVRKQRNANGPAAGLRLTLTPFLLAAIAQVLRALPRFNAALDEGGKQLILRNYVHVGLAIDTPGGLLVAVIRDCDAKSVDTLSAEAAGLAHKARGRGLSLAEMSGGGFTLSALGALGGTGFTPIINSPEVAILGVGRLTQTPRPGADGGIDWRAMLPASLSYDHRVVNGADAGRFMLALQQELGRLAAIA